MQSLRRKLWIVLSINFESCHMRKYNIVDRIRNKFLIYAIDCNDF